MTVNQLRHLLEDLPQDAIVTHLWDGEARTEIQLVWLARDGSVVTSDYYEACYSDGTRPLGAPTAKEDLYWRTKEEQ